MLSSHKRCSKKCPGYKLSFVNFALNLFRSQALITTCLSSRCIQVLQATSLKQLDKVCKKTAPVVNKVTDLYFCQDLQLCQWNWDIRFQDIGGCCSCLCWMKRKFHFLSLDTIIFHNPKYCKRNIHRCKKYSNKHHDCYCFPSLSWFFLFWINHCTIFQVLLFN